MPLLTVSYTTFGLIDKPVLEVAWTGSWKKFVDRLLDHGKPTPHPDLALSGSSDPEEVVRSRAVKKTMPAWCPVKLIPGATKPTIKSVESISMLVLDFEPPKPKKGQAPDMYAGVVVDMDLITEVWGDWTALFFTSTGHRPESPRCRLILPLDRPATPAEYKRIWGWAVQRCESAGLPVDVSTKDISRRWLFPYVNEEPWEKDSRAEVWGGQGPLVVAEICSDHRLAEADGAPLAYIEGDAGTLFFTEKGGLDPLTWMKKRAPGNRVRGFCPMIPAGKRKSCSAWMTRYKSGVMIGCTSGNHGHDVPLKVWYSDPNCIGTAKLPPAKLPALDWKVDKNGNNVAVKPTRHNIRVILETDPRFFKRLLFDPANHRIILDGEPALPHQLDSFQATVERTYGDPGFPETQFVYGMFAVAAKKKHYDPLKDSLESLKWDGVSRLDTWLQRTFQVEDTEINRLIQRRWLIQCASRALFPGVKADTVLVLGGKQGYGKSTALEIIAGGLRFYSNSKLHLEHRSAPLQLAGAWIHELAELASIRRHDAESVKAFLSQLDDKFVPPYGKVAIALPRRCCFAATTNAPEYLNDPSGARRFWTVQVDHPADLIWLRNNRDQLIAEAVHEAKAGAKFWFDLEEQQALEEIQYAFQEADPWETRVKQWIGRKPDTVVLVTQLLREILDLQPHQQTSGAASKMGRILMSLGWSRHQFRPTAGASPEKYYVRPKADEIEAADTVRKLWRKESSDVSGGVQ